MKKPLEKIQSMSDRKKKLLILSVVVVVSLIAAATYPFWRTDWGSGNTDESIFSKLFSSFGDAQRDINKATDNLKETSLEYLQSEEYRKQVFELNLDEFEYYTNVEQNVNDVAVNVRKVLLEDDLTVVWLRIKNVGEKTVSIDPTKIAIKLGTVVYSPKKLMDPDKIQEYVLTEGQAEIQEVQEIAPEELIEGFMAFETVPRDGAFAISVADAKLEGAETTWDFEFEFNSEALAEKKAK